MKRTGVFYHEVCGKKPYKVLVFETGVEEGFESLKRERLFEEPNVFLFESEPVPEELILKVHTEDMVERVKRSGYYETSLYSSGGNVGAFEKVLTNQIDNALVFVGDGGHHSGKNYFGGGCFFNTEAIAVKYAREKFGIRKFAIVDTDTHHANGTIDIFQEDDDLLYICFCGSFFDGYPWSFGSWEDTRTKICLPHGGSDEEEIENVRREVPRRVREFKPELLYWMCGVDTHKDSYGTRRLTERCYPKLAGIIKQTADEVCQGKLVVKAAVNAPAHVTEYVNPRLVDCLAELNKYPVEE